MTYQPHHSEDVSLKTATLTADEMAMVVQVLEENRHGTHGDDFEPECPACTATDKLKSALGVPHAPPECKTEAEKRAFAFGWWKALEAQRKGTAS